MQVSDIQTAFEKYKRDISDVTSESGLFEEWVQFVTRFVYNEVKKLDPERFIKKQSYNVVKPPQAFSLPSDFNDMNQTGTGLFVYDMRKRLVVSFSSTDGITYSDTGGTSAFNTNIYVQGDSSRGFTGDAAATLNLSFSTAINWNDFDDGGADSPDNDYISIWIYVGNSIPTSATLGFSTSNDGSDVGVNEFTYTYSSLAEGWNRIKVKKSDFTQAGTLSWSSIGYITLAYAGGASDTNIYWDKLDLVESEVNGNDQTNTQLGVTGYGNTKQGYYLRSSYIEFTDSDQVMDKYYVMRYLPIPPTIDSSSDYITVDSTSTGTAIIRDQDMEYMVKAVDVLYEQWDVDPSRESIADFRFTRALSGLLDNYKRTPNVPTMYNSLSGF